MALLFLTLLGGFHARLASGETFTLPSRKAQGLLAYLAIHPGRPHAREKIASLLWGDADEDRARNSLRQTLFTLRRVLPSPAILRAEGDNLSLDPALVEVDVAGLERIVENDADTLAQVPDVYGGDLLEGFTIREAPFEEWLLGERERLRERALNAMRWLLDHQAGTDAVEAAIQTAVRILALDPIQETVHRQLIRLFLRQERYGAALRQYQQCVDVIQRELGLELEPETQALHAEIVRRAAPPHDRLPGARPAVLVVEDDVVTRTVLEQFLTEADYDVVLAENGADALLWLGRRPFDVVLSDIHMPTLDGLELVETMSQRGLLTPAIFLTALPGDELEVKGFELGAADYIRKPIQKDILLARVRNALKRGRPLSG